MSVNWQNIDRSLECIIEELNTEKFVIVGAGVRGCFLKEKLEERGLFPQCMFDNNESLWGERESDVIIHRPVKLGEDTDYIIAIDNVVARDEVRTQLIDLGIEEKNIYIYYESNYQFWRELDAAYYQREISALYKATFDTEMDWENPNTYN